MFDSFGRRVSTSIAIARNVLTSETASAPASSAARANDATSVTFGVSFGMTGRRRHLAHRADDVVRAGQAAAERDAAFLDVRAGDVQLDRGDAFGIRQDPRDLDVLVERRPADVDEDDVAPARAVRAASRATNRCTPMPCRPIAFSMPAGVSTMRGGGWPSRSARNRPLTATPPSVERSTTSRVLDAVAEAAARGDQGIRERQRTQMETERFMSVRERVPDDARGVEHRPVDARAHEMWRPPPARWSGRRNCNSRRGRSPSPVRARRHIGRPCVAASLATARIIGVGPQA